MSSDAPGLVTERDRALAEQGARPPWWRFVARRRYDARRRAIMAMDVSAFAWTSRQIYQVEQIEELAHRQNLSYAGITKEPK